MFELNAETCDNVAIDAMTGEDLADAIFEFAAGNRCLQAASRQLSTRPDLLERADFRACCTEEPVGVSVDWVALACDGLAVSEQDRAFVRVAASLACRDVQVSLHDVLPALSGTDQGTVWIVFEYAMRGPNRAPAM